MRLNETGRESVPGATDTSVRYEQVATRPDDTLPDQRAVSKAQKETVSGEDSTALGPADGDTPRSFWLDCRDTRVLWDPKPGEETTNSADGMRAHASTWTSGG